LSPIVTYCHLVSFRLSMATATRATY
jgi:hypothetical protein